MTKLFLLFLAFSLFIYSGCSTEHVLTHEKSADSTYSEFARSLKNHSVQVQGKNGKSWEVSDAVVRSDTLQFEDEASGTLDAITIPLAKIKDLSYLNLSTNDSCRIVAVTVKDGGHFVLYGTKFTPQNLSGVYRKPVLLPMQSLSFIRYKEHTYASIEGAIGGAAVGFLSIILAHPSIKGKDDNAKFFGSPFPIFGGVLIGGVTGWIVGHTVTYRIP
jgi:hypothetical protein